MNKWKVLLILLVLMMPVNSLAESIDDIIKPQLLKKAWDLLKAQRPQEAINTISEYQADDSSLPYYYFIYGKALREIKKTSMAVENLRLAYIYSTGDLRALSLLERANSYLDMEYFYEARIDYLRFIKEFSDSKYIQQAHLGLAKSLSEIGILKEALSHYELAGDTPDAVLGKANTLQRLGMVKEANDIYISVIQKNSEVIKKDDESLYYFGENLRLMNKYLEAKKYLSLVRGSQFKAKASISLAMIATNESRMEEAIKYLNLALLSNDRKIKRQALLNLAEMHLRLGKMNEAISNLENIRYNYPYGSEYYEAILRLSGLYRQKGQFNRAGALLKEIVFSASSFKKEALDELEKTILDVIEKDKSLFIELWRSVGKWMFDNSREQTLLKIAEDLENKNILLSFEIYSWLSRHGSKDIKIPSISAMSNFYADIGDANKAEEYIKMLKGMKISADDIKRMESRMLFLKGDAGSSAELLLSIKNLNSEDLALLGKTLTATKDIKKATAVYERALKEVGGDSWAHIRLADILYEQGRTAEALNYYKLAMDKDPSNEWVLYRISEIGNKDNEDNTLSKIKNDPVLMRLSNIKLRELDINRKTMEIF
jgi:tetratricopeptide (TPR) repeat protein